MTLASSRAADASLAVQGPALDAQVGRCLRTMPPARKGLLLQSTCGVAQRLWPPPPPARWAPRPAALDRAPCRAAPRGKGWHGGCLRSCLWWAGAPGAPYQDGKRWQQRRHWRRLRRERAAGNLRMLRLTPAQASASILPRARARPPRTQTRTNQHPQPREVDVLRHCPCHHREQACELRHCYGIQENCCCCCCNKGCCSC